MNNRIRWALGIAVAAVILAQSVAITYLSNSMSPISDTRTTQLEGRLLEEITKVCTIAGESPAKRLLDQFDRLNSAANKLENCPEVLKSSSKAADEVAQLRAVIGSLYTAVSANTAATNAAQADAALLANRLPPAADEWFSNTLKTVQRVDDVFKCPGNAGEAAGICVGGQSHVYMPVALANLSAQSSLNHAKTEGALSKMNADVNRISTGVAELFKPIVQQLRNVSAASAVIQEGVQKYAADAAKSARVTLESRRIVVSLPVPTLLNCADLDIAFGAYQGDPQYAQTLLMPQRFYEDVVMGGQPDISLPFVRLAVRAPLTESVNSAGTARCTAVIPIGPSAYEMFSKSKRQAVIEIIVSPEGNRISVVMAQSN
jgi:hypothetical protein